MTSLSSERFSLEKKDDRVDDRPGSFQYCKGGNDLGKISIKP